MVSISGMLDGAIFGDHCSPISDTTVLSSICSGCEHLDHVRTQIPYALLGAVVAALAGYALVGAWGADLWVGMAAGMTGILVLIHVVGRRDPNEKGQSRFPSKGKGTVPKEQRQRDSPDSRKGTRGRSRFPECGTGTHGAPGESRPEAAQ